MSLLSAPSRFSRVLFSITEKTEPDMFQLHAEARSPGALSSARDLRRAALEFPAALRFAIISWRPVFASDGETRQVNVRPRRRSRRPPFPNLRR